MILFAFFVDRNHPVGLDGFCGALCAASHRLARGVEGVGRARGIEEEFSIECIVKRSGEWSNMELRNLVPGDLVKLTLVGLILADCEVLDGKLIQVDTSKMIGESLPVTMRKGDKCGRSLPTKRLHLT